MVKNATIVGSVPFGHFGHSITDLGDLNNDGCDGEKSSIWHAMLTSCIYADIAVGAPFDDGGKVFIYHGSNSTSIIDTTVRQVQLYR